jgi:hypothetical protein
MRKKKKNVEEVKIKEESKEEHDKSPRTKYYWELEEESMTEEERVLGNGPLSRTTKVRTSSHRHIELEDQVL